MSAIDNQPDNPNPLSPINFRFVLNRTPNVIYTVQSITLPSISVGEPPYQTPFAKLPVGGDNLAYTNLSMRFQVHENLDNWLEIHNWLEGIGNPESFDTSIHPNISGGGVQDRINYLQNKGVHSDGTLTILTSAKNPNARIFFKDLSPVSLSPVQFDLTQADIQYLEADVDFVYRNYTIESINS